MHSTYCGAVHDRGGPENIKKDVECRTGMNGKIDPLKIFKQNRIHRAVLQKMTENFLRMIRTVRRQSGFLI